jgi:hypothetical protein
MDTMILNLEKQFFRTAGAKEEAIRALGLSPVRYYQLVNRLLDDPAAMQVDPVTVKRLLRIRTDRRRSGQQPPRPENDPDARTG